MAEADRYATIKRVLAKKVTQAAVALEMGLSVRYVKRMCAGVRAHGASALVSKKRGVANNRRIALQVRKKFVDLVASRYSDFGPKLAHEYLTREHGFAYSI